MCGAVGETLWYRECSEPDVAMCSTCQEGAIKVLSICNGCGRALPRSQIIGSDVSSRPLGPCKLGRAALVTMDMHDPDLSVSIDEARLENNLPNPGSSFYDLNDDSLDIPRPILWRTSTGEPLLARGQRAWMIGHEASGKTWAALMCARQVLDDGGFVLLIDWESGPRRIRERARILGLLQHAGDRFWAADGSMLYRDGAEGKHSPRADHAAALARIQDLDPMSEAGHPALVIIDSASPAGLERDTGSSVTSWLDAKVQPWVDAGATVIVIDHKAKIGGIGAAGSGDKLAQTDIAIEARAGPTGLWGRDRDGSTTLYITKDRDDVTGLPVVSRERGEPLASVRCWYDADACFAWEVTAPTPELGASVNIESVICDILSDGQKSKRKLISCLKATSNIGQAAAIAHIEEAVSSGAVKTKKVGNSIIHSLPEDADENVPQAEQMIIEEER